MVADSTRTPPYMAQTAKYDSYTDIESPNVQSVYPQLQGSFVV